MGNRKRKKHAWKPGICYHCGQWCEHPTDEHVPPKCLSPDTPQSQFIHVPSCKKCNSTYEAKESRFRDYAVFVAQQRGATTVGAAYEKFQRNITRQEQERAGQPHKDLQRLLDSLAGVIYLDEQKQMVARSLHITTAQDDFYEHEVFIKIARGIHYHHSHTVSPAGTQIYIYRLMLGEFAKLLEEHPNLHYRQIGDFFTYLGGYNFEQPETGIWVMNLYDALGVVVSFEKEQRSRSIRRSLGDLALLGPSPEKGPLPDQQNR